MSSSAARRLAAICSAWAIASSSGDFRRPGCAAGAAGSGGAGAGRSASGGGAAGSNPAATASATGSLRSTGSISSSIPCAAKRASGPGSASASPPCPASIGAGGNSASGCSPASSGEAPSGVGAGGAPAVRLPIGLRPRRRAPPRRPRRRGGRFGSVGWPCGFNPVLDSVGDIAENTLAAAEANAKANHKAEVICRACAQEPTRLRVGAGPSCPKAEHKLALQFRASACRGIRFSTRTPSAVGRTAAACLAGGEAVKFVASAGGSPLS